MIEINNLTAVSIDESFLKAVAQKVLKGEKQEDKDLSIALVGQEKIKELNKRYRGENRATDVLAFPGNGLGEIVICLKEVKKNAKRFNSVFEKELARVLIHGILHLSGYDHEKREIEARKMMKKEKDYLLSINF